jgi:hypothetical protein
MKVVCRVFFRYTRQTFFFHSMYHVLFTCATISYETKGFCWISYLSWQLVHTKLLHAKRLHFLKFSIFALIFIQNVVKITGETIHSKGCNI